MTVFIIRRIVLAVIVLLLVTLIVFMSMRILPGDPIYMIITANDSGNTSIEEINRLRHEYGLDKPLILQYFSWLGDVAQGDLGRSIVQKQPVSKAILERIPVTLNLSILALIFGLLVGIPAGVICALKRGRWIDTVVTIFANLGITMPTFWLGFILIYIFSLQLHWLPTQGYTSPLVDAGKNIRQIIMPVFCLSIFPLASITRQTRSSMLEVLRQDYIRTAWAKGLRERSIVIRHALKNGLIPVITLTGMSLSNIIGGSVIIETVFNIPGMGRTAVNAVFAHDYPIVQGCVFVIAITVLLVNLLVDISYGWLDPRIRYN
jgi:peptide/nickel transport system permease protein